MESDIKQLIQKFEEGLTLVSKRLIYFSFPFSDLTKVVKQKFSEMKRSGMHRMATSGITDNVCDLEKFYGTK